jgi:hypothetical protein
MTCGVAVPGLIASYSVFAAFSAAMSAAPARKTGNAPHAADLVEEPTVPQLLRLADYLD